MNTDIDLVREASIGSAHDPLQELAIRAVVRWVDDEVHVESDTPLPDDVIAAVRLALAPHRRRQIGNPVETLDGKFLIHLVNILAPEDRATESVCECTDSSCVAYGVWVSAHRRDPHWSALIGTPCPRTEGHVLTVTPLGERLLAEAGLTLGADGKVASQVAFTPRRT